MTATTHPAGPFRHELVLHDGAAELLALTIPFLREGAAAGEHVVVHGDADFVETFRAAVPDVPVQLLAEEPDERFPGRELHRAQQLLAQLDGGPRVRVVNQMPAMTGRQWFGWRRYEAATNVVLAPYRAWAKCAHDLAGLDARMVAELRASHRFVQTATGGGRNADYDERGAHTDGYLDVPPHPVEGTEPTLSMLAPTASAARRAVGDLAVRSLLSPAAQECLVLAASEAVTNGWVHGRPPVLLRAWAHGGKVTVAVSDDGTGPHPLVGMLPAAPDSPSGRGMWMVHLLLPEVHHRRGPDGYTITFTVDDDAPRLSA